MANRNKSKGRSAERDVIEYLEHLGWEAVDVHHNDALEGLTNADVLGFPTGIKSALAEDLVRDGYEIQVKYSSVNSYGFRGVYNRHDRLGVDLGTYTRSGAGACFGEFRAINWTKYGHPLLFSGGINAMLDAIDTSSIHSVCCDNVMGKQVRGFVDGCDILMCREPYKPWLVIWRGSLKKK